jgi:two-component system, OmpR family, phosphate regulon sensor histidine kinase PhoR
LRPKSILPLLIALFIYMAILAFVLAKTALSLWIAIPVLVIAAFLTARLLFEYLMRPIRSLMQVADSIASKDLTARMPENQSWEIVHLAEFSNYMLDRMAASIERHRESRDELQLILSSVEDALWVQDTEGRIELCNPVFEELFPLAQASGQVFCWEVIRERELLRMIKEVSEEEKARISEITLNEHTYLLSASLNREAGKLIFILQNIDDIKATEQMKKDFALNVAHELRTPLTAIKGFVDIVTEDYPQNRYLSIIQRHTDRLIALVGDLEELARLERAPRLDLQDICLKTFFTNIQSIFENSLKEKGLALTLNIDPPQLRAKLDPYKMEQVFINLIDNAIRYTMSGGIHIHARQQDAELIITVKDTGKGIPATQVSRVFERFYTVDQSRSRSTGGTGLGLAIVKHIVVSHGGRISLESALGEGSCFRIVIPACVS